MTRYRRIATATGNALLPAFALLGFGLVPAMVATTAVLVDIIKSYVRADQA